MQHSPNENYACQCDPVQPKTRRPRPKKEVHKPDPKKIFDGLVPPKAPKPAAKKPKVRRRKKRTDKTR
jgi:hypothetical protein